MACMVNPIDFNTCVLYSTDIVDPGISEVDDWIDLAVLFHRILDTVDMLRGTVTQGEFRFV